MDWRDLFEAGRKALAEGDLAGAAERLLAAWQGLPPDTDPAEAGAVGEALVAARGGAVDDPAAPVAAHMLAAAAEARVVEGRLVLAERLLRRAVALARDADRRGIERRLASVVESVGRLDDAIAIRRALVDDPSAPVDDGRVRDVERLALVLARARADADADAACRSALAMRRQVRSTPEQLGRTWRVWASCLARAGDGAAAQDRVAVALALEAGVEPSIRSLDHAVDELLSGRRPDDALGVLRGIAEADVDPAGVRRAVERLVEAAREGVAVSVVGAAALALGGAAVTAEAWSAFEAVGVAALRAGTEPWPLVADALAHLRAGLASPRPAPALRAAAAHLAVPEAARLVAALDALYEPILVLDTAGYRGWRVELAGVAGAPQLSALLAAVLCGDDAGVGLPDDPPHNGVVASATGEEPGLDWRAPRALLGWPALREDGSLAGVGEPDPSDAAPARHRVEGPLWAIPRRDGERVVLLGPPGSGDAGRIEAPVPASARVVGVLDAADVRRAIEGLLAAHGEPAWVDAELGAWRRAARALDEAGDPRGHARAVAAGLAVHRRWPAVDAERRARLVAGLAEHSDSPEVLAVALAAVEQAGDAGAVRLRYGALLRRAHRVDEAVGVLRSACAELAGTPREAEALGELARALGRRGEVAVAAELQARAVELAESRLEAERGRVRLARLLGAIPGRQEAAVATWRAAVEGLGAVLGDPHPELASALRRGADYLEASGEAGEAARWRALADAMDSRIGQL